MAALLANAVQGAGVATGAQKGFSAEREASRATARANKEVMDQKLRATKATRMTESDLQTVAETQSLEIQAALQKQQQLVRQNNKVRTFDAFDRYDNGGYETRHLNTMFTDLAKNGSKMFGDIARADKITEQDRELINNQGLLNAEEIINDPDVNASYVKTTTKDGKVEIRSLDDLKGATGYNDYASEKELARQKRETEITLMKSLGYATNELSREAFRRAAEEVRPDVDRNSPEFQEAYTKHYDALNAKSRVGRRGTGNGPNGENLTEKEAEAARRVGMQGLNPGEEGYDAAFSEAMSDINTEYSRPSTQRNLEAADEARVALDDMDFFDMEDTTNLKDRAKIERHINKIEQSAGVEMTTADKATLERINELTHLGSAAGELTDDQTGLIDRVFRGVSKYISDNTEGVAQEAAYAGYRNVVRNALYGSVLTTNESKAFVEQFGSLGQQRGPILAQLSMSLQQLKSNYETLVATNDPYVIKHRTGKTSAELYDTINALDERIDMIGGVMSGKPVPSPDVNRPSQASTQAQAQDTVLTPDKRAQLDAIYGKTGQAGVTNED